MCFEKILLQNYGKLHSTTPPPPPPPPILSYATVISSFIVYFIISYASALEEPSSGNKIKTDLKKNDGNCN